MSNVANAPSLMLTVRQRKMKPKCQNCHSPLGFWRRVFSISYFPNNRKLRCKNCGKESGYSYRTEFAVIQFLAVGTFLISFRQVNELLALASLFLVLLVLPATFLKMEKKEGDTSTTKFNRSNKAKHEPVATGQRR